MAWSGDLTLGFLVRGRFDSGDFALHTAAGTITHDADLTAEGYAGAMTPADAGAPDYRWPLSGTIAEAGGHGTTGTLSETPPAIVPALSGPCAWFAGDGLTVASAADIDTGATTRRSWAAWVRPDRVDGWRNIWEEGSATAWAALQVDAGTIRFVLGGGGTVLAAPSGAVVAGTVYHVVAVADFTASPPVARLYLDGAEVAAQTFADGDASFGAHAGGARIAGAPATRRASGATTGGLPFVGRLQDVALWTDAILSPAEIAAIHDKGAGDPVTYEGAGMFLQIAPAEGSTGDEKPGLSLSLVGAAPEVLTLAEAEEIQRRRVDIYLAAFDEDGNVAATQPYFFGLADTLETDDDPENPVATLSIEGRELDLGRPRPFFYLPEDQRSRFPDDSFFDLVAVIQNQDEEWGQ